MAQAVQVAEWEAWEAWEECQECQVCQVLDFNSQTHLLQMLPQVFKPIPLLVEQTLMQLVLQVLHNQICQVEWAWEEWEEWE